MFGLFVAVAKRIDDQIAEYAAAQSHIARRAYGEWLAPFQSWQPARVAAKRASPATHSRQGPPAKRARPSR